MGDVLKNSLIQQDRKKFQVLSQTVVKFNSLYNGGNIIQDDIFSILINYAKQNGKVLELFRFPVNDDDFCAMTCVRQDKIFVFVNSALPLCNQIFAAAHELYHIYCYVSEKDESVLRRGSLLNAASMDEDAQNSEDREANAFAGMLLAPDQSLLEQMKIYGIRKDNQDESDVIRLMAIFAMPYKAILLRLYEEKYMDEVVLRRFLALPWKALKKTISYEPDAFRWQKSTPEIHQIGSLEQLMEQNEANEFLSNTRAESDRKILSEILFKYQNHRG